MQHDTISQFDASTEGEEGVFPVNIHKKALKIAPSLTLLGLGGSVPSFTYEGKHVWDGFPYDNDKKFGEHLNHVLELVDADESEHPEESYIIMTHNGPLRSSKPPSTYSLMCNNRNE